MTYYFFNIEIATKYGIEEAIILRTLSDEIFKTEKNLIPMTRKKLVQILPYLSEAKIRRALNKLIKCELIVSSKVDAKNFNQTKWYEFTDKGIELFNLIKNLNNAIMC